MAAGKRGHAERDVAGRAAEDRARPEVEAMSADRVDGAARWASVRSVGQLGGEQRLQGAAERVAVEPSCGFVHLAFLSDGARGAVVTGWCGPSFTGGVTCA